MLKEKKGKWFSRSKKPAFHPHFCKRPALGRQKMVFCKVKNPFCKPFFSFFEVNLLRNEQITKKYFFFSLLICNFATHVKHKLFDYFSLGQYSIEPLHLSVQKKLLA